MQEGAVETRAADAGVAYSAHDATTTVAPNDGVPRATDPPRPWTRPGDTIHTDETGCAHLFPSLEGEIPFSRELLHQIAQRLRGATEDELDIAGSFDRLEALLSIRLPVRANTLDRRDTWETPVDHVLRSLFRDSAKGGSDLESLILARRDDRIPPPQYLSAESIANAVASMSKLYADLTGMYGEDRLFERVVNTARSNAWLSHVASTLFDIACATEHRTVAEPGDARLATIVALDNRLLTAETRSRVLQRRPAAQCNRCQENLNRLEDLRAFMANLETTKTGLAISVGELTSRLDTMRTQLQRRSNEYQDARDRIFDLEDEVRRLQAEVSKQKKIIATKARTADTHLLSKKQAWNVYKFCWSNSAAYGDPKLWWQLVTACALDKPENLPPVQLMVTAAPPGVPDTGDAPDVPDRFAAWAPPSRDGESSEDEKEEQDPSSRRKASRDASTRMTLTAEFDKELSAELAGGSSPGSVIDVDLESMGDSDTGEYPSRKAPTKSRAPSASKQRGKRKADEGGVPRQPMAPPSTQRNNGASVST